MIERLLEMAFSGTIGNFTYDRVKSLLNTPKDDKDLESEKEEPSLDPDIKDKFGSNIIYKNNYRTFDIVHDLYDIVGLIKSPMVHIVIEDQPSSAWHLPLVVVEDTASREWYVFSKGRMAFEGSGGGLANSKELLRYLINNRIRFSGWVLDYVNSEKLSQGCLTWPALRDQCLPLISYNKNQFFTKYVVEVFGELSSPNR
ncbi:hypothetical protein [Marinimicrobium locisalis]|uniref:hypothetical protein n=1 Tax=Marinimicrobium locisalis TaxID=546022 RepID=UPI0032219670